MKYLQAKKTHVHVQMEQQGTQKRANIKHVSNSQLAYFWLI